MSQALAGNMVHPSHAPKAMVATVQPDASDAGVEIMKAGGNAVDAAVAVGFALTVTHPEAGNIGGGGFMLFRRADGEVHFLDYREKAPAKATADMYLDKDGNVIKDMSTLGYKAIAVPSSVAGLAYAQKHWGKLTLKQVMEPAIRLARDGFVLDYATAMDLRDEDLGKFAESRRIFQRDGNFYQPGDVFKQPELAKTLERIAKNPDDFYHGDMARELAAAMQKGGGLITAEDLASYEVKERSADSRNVSRLRRDQCAASVVGGRGAGRDPQHSRRLRSRQAGQPVGREHSPDGRGLSAGVLRPRGVHGRSGFREDSGGAIDRQALCRGVARDDSAAAGDAGQ